MSNGQHFRGRGIEVGIPPNQIYSMSLVRLSFKKRLLLLQEEFRDTVFGITFFCAFALATAIPIVMRQNNPIIGTQRVRGTVEYVTTMPLNPKISVGQGFHYRYEVRLDDSKALVFVDGEVETPHIIGSEVFIERQHHKNNTETYQLLPK